jgi:hypothetical protein
VAAPLADEFGFEVAHAGPIWRGRIRFIVSCLAAR